MAFDMVDWYDGDVPANRQSLCEVCSNYQCPNQTGGVCDRNAIDFSRVNTCLLQRFADDKGNRLHVCPGSQLWDNPAILGVDYLRRNHICQ